MAKAEIIIQNGKKLYAPEVLEDIEWQTERAGEPGKLTFKVIWDSKLNIEEGNAVRFKWNKTGVFYGFVFKIKTDKDKILTITAYDQLRYLKNKETYVYSNKKASDVVRMIAKDFSLNAGSIEDTNYTIPSRTEDNQSLFDIIQNALDVTLTNKATMYVLYDNFGKLTLKSLDKMKTNILIDEETAETYDFETTIDKSYNKIKLVYDNQETGKREVYITKHSKNMNKWGVLQYYDTLQDKENGAVKAETLLKLYNQKQKKLTIKNAFGSLKVRAGSMVVVNLNICGTKVKNYMLVETCKHTFKVNEHRMELKLRGGEFTGE